MSRETLVVNAELLATALRQTKAGESLAGIYRWSSFRSSETDADWRELLGATAIDIEHGELMYELGSIFLEQEKGRFTPEQEELFLYGFLVHDFGEAIIDENGIGDVSAQIKTTEHEKIENGIARAVIDSLPVDPTLKDKLLLSYQQVVEGGDPELHKAFKALEKTEYVMTALIAYQNCRSREEQGKSGILLEKPMVGRVLVIDLSKVLNVFAPEYPSSIGRYVRSMEPVIEEAYQYTESWLRQNSWRNLTADHNELCDQFEAKWEAFKDSNIGR